MSSRVESSLCFILPAYLSIFSSSLIVLKTVLHGTALKALGRGHGKRAHEAQVQLMNNVTVNMQKMPKNELAKKK